MKFVLCYEAAPDFRAKVLLHIEAHRAAFVARDPFVTSGLVATWTIREWMEALVPE